MGASSATPVDSLRNKAWVERHGHTASIMDYARFNYVAQPEDNIGEAGTFPRIGDYDKWAINWGYRCFPDSKGEKDERLTLNKMTMAKLKESRRYWFGGEGNDNDPKAQTEDLGDDAMKAGSYGIKNLKRIIKHLPEWNYEEGDMDENVRSAYRSLVQQMSRYANHVAANIGGGYHDFKSVEQPGETFTPVDRATQKRALAWLEENVFKEPTWLISEPYVRRLVRVPENNIFGIADRVLDKLTSAMTINLVSKHATGAGSYQPMELVNDLVGCLFRSTATGTKATLWTRHLQRRAVGNFIKAWKVTIVDEQRPYALAAIQQIKTRLQQARTTDAATRAHYADLLQQIKIALSGMPTTKESKAGAVME